MDDRCPHNCDNSGISNLLENPPYHPDDASTRILWALGFVLWPTHRWVVVNPEGRSADSLARCCSPVHCCLVHCSPLHCSIKQLLKHRKNTVQQWCSAIHYTESKSMLYWIQQHTIKGDSLQNWLPCLRQHCKSKYALQSTSQSMHCNVLHKVCHSM